MQSHFFIKNDWIPFITKSMSCQKQQTYSPLQFRTRWFRSRRGKKRVWKPNLSKYLQMFRKLLLMWQSNYIEMYVKFVLLGVQWFDLFSCFFLGLSSHFRKDNEGVFVKLCALIRFIVEIVTKVMNRIFCLCIRYFALLRAQYIFDAHCFQSLWLWVVAKINSDSK